MKTNESPDYARKAQQLLESLRQRGGGRVPRGTFKEIARKTDGEITYDYLYQLSRGHIKTPSVEKLRTLTNALGIPLDWWTLPVDVGPPPMIEGVEDISARLTELPPERQAEAVRRVLEVLGQITAEEEDS
jgi:transcriptional regulator with XRE-family HTH domain